MKTVFALCLATALPLAAETTQQSFQVAPSGRLTIDSQRGAIEITSGNADRIEIRIENADKLDLEFDHDGADLNINGQTVEGLLSRFNPFAWNSENQPKFFITVPKRYNLDLKTGGGHIHIDDLEGSVQARTAGGHIDLGRIAGPVDARTSGGHIKLVSCSGQADLRTSGGHINIDRVDGNVIARTSGGHIKVNEVLGTIEAKTSGGSVTATITRQPTAACILKTSGGHVNVSLAHDIAVNVDAHTSGGRIHTDFPVSGELGRHLRSPINGGGPQLNLRTSGGHIHLKKL